ncbi:MAG: CidA/LrgA family protein [[Ruminococcus] gnavus]|nr:CidA/LrgA family protein [Mediterraneibacter gnavus]
MKILKQFVIILLISFLGEVLKAILPLPVPASVWGLLLMLVALRTGMIKLSQVSDAAGFLIEIMPVMFIPAGVGLLNAWGVLQPIWIPISVITILTTVIVMAVTGKVTQAVIQNQKKKKEKAEQRTER